MGLARRARVPTSVRRRASLLTSLGFATGLSCTYAVLVAIGWADSEKAPAIGPGRQLSSYPDDPIIDKEYGEASNRYLVFIHVILICYMLLGLNTVCDIYFTGALDAMVMRWKIKADVAGATFMAAGGSAPELFTSLIGTLVTENDVGFGTIVGSAVFNVLFVIGLCGFAASEPIQLTWWPLLRDCVCYIIGLAVLAWFASDERILITEAIVLFVLYLGYIAIMFFNVTLEAAAMRSVSSLDSALEKETDDKPGQLAPVAPQQDVCPTAPPQQAWLELKGKIDASTEGDNDSVEVRCSKDAGAKVCGLDVVSLEDSVRDGHKVTNGRNDQDAISGSESESLEDKDTEAKPTSSMEPMRIEEVAVVPGTAPLATRGSSDMEMSKVCQSQSGSKVQLQNTNSDGKSISTAWAVMPTSPASTMSAFTLPVGRSASRVIARAQTAESIAGSNSVITEGEEEEDDAKALLTRPEGFTDQVLWFLALPIYVPLYFSIPAPGGHYFLATFTMSLVWIAIFSFFMVWWVEILGEVLGIPTIIMGFTLLAMGTSIPDAVSSVSVARMGEGDMAVSSSIGSNIFDILVGLPIPWMIKLSWELSKGNSGAEKDNSGAEVKIVSPYLAFYVVLLLFMVFSVIISIHMLGWKLKKSLGLVMALLYLIFLATAVGVEVGKPSALEF